MPINDIIIDLRSKSDIYFVQGYQAGYTSIIDKDKYIYYMNDKTENPIVVKLFESEQTPRFINEDNFIFDYDSYYEYRDYCFLFPDECVSDSYDYDDDDWD